MEKFYQQFFGSVSNVSTKRINEIDEQRKNYDVLITLDNGQFFKVKEKRDRYHHMWNIVLELWADVGRKKGWLYTAQCDWLAYHFDVKNVTHMIPFPALKRAWDDYETEWRGEYRVMINESMRTEFILIPLDVMWAAINDVMVYAP